MGYYVNPRDGRSKEQWLAENTATNMSRRAPSSINAGPEGTLPVCLVDNMMFTAAAICYSQRELEDFARDDGREKAWCFVPIAKLIEVEPSVANALAKAVA